MSVLLQPAVFCIVDTETTGLDPSEDGVCELAGIFCENNGEELSRYESLVNPGREIPPDASAIHHLVDEDVALAPDLPTALKALLETPFDIWVAHNAAFDFGFLPAFGRPVLCTLRMARKLYPEAPKHSNQYLRYALKLQVPEAKGLPAHRAMADVLVTKALLFHLLEEVAKQHPELDTFEKLVAWSQEPILEKICWFGNKHRGVPWAEVPKTYLDWMLKNVTDLAPDTRQTVEHWAGKEA